MACFVGRLDVNEDKVEPLQRLESGVRLGREVGLEVPGGAWNVGRGETSTLADAANEVDGGDDDTGRAMLQGERGQFALSPLAPRSEAAMDLPGHPRDVLSDRAGEHHDTMRRSMSWTTVMGVGGALLPPSDQRHPRKRHDRHRRRFGNHGDVGHHEMACLDRTGCVVDQR